MTREMTRTPARVVARSTAWDSHSNLNEARPYGPGGGRVGAIVLSKYVKSGTVSDKGYSHCSQLRSFEDLFGLKHVGDAPQPQVHSFGPEVYTQPSG